MGLANIKMAGANALTSKETLTLNANTTSTAYSSSTSNNAFYALDEFSTNQPYKIGVRNTSTLNCYFIVNPTGNYSFSTTYRYGDLDSYRQWNSFAISSSSNTILNGNYREITTSAPKFKYLARVYSYISTQHEQTYTALYGSTKYKLEVWGARGARQYANDHPINDRVNKTYVITSTDYYGRGGYACGNVSLTESQVLYIYTGGRGAGTNIIWVGSTPSQASSAYFDNSQSDVRTGYESPYHENYYIAYNGGGEGCQPGGGATHIATTSRGELMNYKNYKSEVLIVGGGGGGAEWGTGGHGGGLTGQDSGNVCTYSLNDLSSVTPAKGGTQSAGGTGGVYRQWVGQENEATYNSGAGDFGIGGSGYSSSNSGPGGGGGWYGGGGTVMGAGGAGGSSYYGGCLSDGGRNTIDGGSIQPSPTSTGTQSGNETDGYARITIMPYD